MENKNSNIIIFDTETTGFPQTLGFDKYYNPSLINFYNNSRLVQLGYIILDKNLNVLDKICFIIKPENFSISNSNIHGITNEKANSEGLDIKYCLLNFYNELIKCDTIVAHNINFDINIISSESYRSGMGFIYDKLFQKNKYCTMKNGKDILKKLKYPKLSELYLFLYPDCSWIQKHDALDDCEKCLDCYRRLSFLNPNEKSA